VSSGKKACGEAGADKTGTADDGDVHDINTYLIYFLKALTK
jgi:hypothetical protein